jgi:hypothetical protein
MRNAATRHAALLTTFALLGSPVAAAPDGGRRPVARPLELQPLGFPHGCANGAKLAACRCSALIPKDAGWAWAEAPAQPYWTAAVRRGNALAVWGIVGVNPAMQGFYANALGDLYGPPAASMQYLANVLVGTLGDRSPTRYTSEPVALGAYSYRYFASQGYRGVVVYRLWSASVGAYAGGQGYIENMYFALAPHAEWEALWRQTTAIALSLGCSAQVVPPSGSDQAGESKEAAKDANAILGTEYVHDESCSNFLVSDSNWIENGPQGAGYYKVVGTDYQKLQSGRCD